MGVRVSGKGFFSHVTIGSAGWSNEETAAAVAFTLNVRVQVFSSPYNTNQTRRVNRFFLCCRGDGADECNTQHCTTAALVSVGSSYNNYLIKYNIVSLTQPKNAKNNKI